MSTIINNCAACGKEDDGNQLCSGCKLVKYCNRECQATHRRAHKKVCPPECLILPDPDEIAKNMEDDIFMSPMPRGHCKCGHPLCDEDQPSPLWRCGIFMGVVQLLSGEFKKVDNPRDLLGPGAKKDWTIFANLPGHLMTIMEIMTEWNHYPDSEMSLIRDANARPLKELLVSFESEVKLIEEDDVYVECMNEIKEFVLRLCPKGLYKKKKVLMAAGIVLGKNLSYFAQVGSTSELDEEDKALIEFLISGGAGGRSTLPADVANDVERAVCIIEMENNELEELKKLKESGGYTDKKMNECVRLFTDSCAISAEEGTEKSNHAPIDNAEEAEVKTLELIKHLSAKMKSSAGKDDALMYPFYVFGSGEKYSDVPPPKVRAGDIVEVTAKRDIEYSDFVIPKDTSVNIYVISLTSFGMVTGILQTNKEKYWVYFPNHYCKKLVIRGKNWS